MTDKLKPVNCGCGGEAKHVTESCWNPEEEKWIPNFWHRVICKNCGTQTKAFYTEAEAIEVWNKAMGAKNVNISDQETVIIEPFTTDMNHVGYCKCGYLVNAEWKYCPSCSARLEWG